MAVAPRATTINRGVSPLTGIQPGDVVNGDWTYLILITRGGTASSCPTPSGWTAVTGSPFTSGAAVVNTDTAVFVWQRVWDGTALPSLAWTGDGSNQGMMVVRAFGGVDPATPADANPVMTTGVFAASSSAILAALTTVTANAYIWHIFGANAGPTGMTVPDTQAALNINRPATGTGHSGAQASAGSTGTRTYSWTGGASATYVGIIFAARAAPLPTTVNPTGIGLPSVSSSFQADTFQADTFDLPTSSAFGLPSVTIGPITAIPVGIGTAEAFGTPTVKLKVTLALTGIVSAETFGTAVVTFGPVTVTPDGIVSSEAFGSPGVSVGALSVNATGIPSGQAFGTPTIAGLGIVIPLGIGLPISLVFQTDTFQTNAFDQGATSQFGFPKVILTSITVRAFGIGSSEAFGSPFVARPPAYDMGLVLVLWDAPARKSVLWDAAVGSVVLWDEPARDLVLVSAGDTITP